MIVHYSTPAEEDLAYWTLHSKKITQRIESLIEGSGILDMIKLCRVAGVSAPEFRQDGGQFVQTLWRPKAVVAVQSDQHSRPTRSAIQSIINQGKAHDETHEPPSVGWNVRSWKPATLPHGVRWNYCRSWVMLFAQETSSAV